MRFHDEFCVLGCRCVCYGFLVVCKCTTHVEHVCVLHVHIVCCNVAHLCVSLVSRSVSVCMSRCFKPGMLAVHDQMVCCVQSFHACMLHEAHVVVPLGLGAGLCCQDFSSPNLRCCKCCCRHVKSVVRLGRSLLLLDKQVPTHSLTDK